jgi:hypothetical protein
MVDTPPAAACPERMRIAPLLVRTDMGVCSHPIWSASALVACGLARKSEKDRPDLCQTIWPLLESMR